MVDDCNAEIGTCAMVDDSMNDTTCADAFNAILQPINYDPTDGSGNAVGFSQDVTPCIADKNGILGRHTSTTRGLSVRPLGCVTDVTRSFLATGEVVVPEMFVVAYFAMSCGV